MSKINLSLARARRLADKVAAELAPVCDRIEIAGSVRRGAAIVGDLELVAIPKRRGLLPDHGASLLDEKLVALVSDGRLVRDQGGERYKRFGIPAVQGLNLDLFISCADRWGVIFALRTGPADFSKALVTPRKYGGRLTDGLAVHDGRVWPASNVFRGMIDAKGYHGPFVQTSGKPLDTPEELDFLHMAGGWYEPAERRANQPIQDCFKWSNAG